MCITTHAGHLAELENAAWKDDRRFRVLAFDKGAFSFADFFFHTPSKPHSSSGPPSEHMHLEEGHNISITGAAFSRSESNKHWSIFKFMICPPLHTLCCTRQCYAMHVPLQAFHP